VVINVFFVLADLDFKFYGFGFQVSGVRCQRWIPRSPPFIWNCV